jgi:hypothetical protein
MRTHTETTNIYKFDELSDSAKETAIQAYSDINICNYGWWEDMYGDAETIGLKLGNFGLNPIYCNGKWIVGAEEAATLVLEHHGPADGSEPDQDACETYKTAWEFQNAVSVQGSIFEAQDDFDADYEEFIESDQYKEMCSEFLTDLCSDYGTMLDKQHDYLQTDEAIQETIEANEYEFLEDGKKYI